MMPEPSSPLQHWQSDTQTEYAGTDELWMIDRCLMRYNHDVVAKLHAYLGSAPHILEFGAGIATLASIWRQQTGVAPDCLEIDATLQQTIRERGFDCYDAIERVPRA